MEGKKISFGFMKTKKAEKPVVEEKRDYIECLEEQSIKIIGGETATEVAPLVIPMKPNTLVTAERLKEIAAKVESSLEETEVTNNVEKHDEEMKSSENETLDQMAVRELLQGAKQEVKVDENVLTVPVPSKPVIEGKKESTLEDYESVPIQDFGMAMLRGMGWTPNKDQSKYKQPQLRPKGLGLGADKIVTENHKKKANSKDKQEELSIVKNSFVKITTGKYSGYYGKVVSLDEDTGRITVDIAVKKETVSLGEFMMYPVTKAEFDKESKVINTDAYEEYKKFEKKQSQKSSRKESPQVRDSSRTSSPKVNEREASSSYRNDKDRREIKEERDQKSSNGKSRENNKYDRSRRDSSSSEDRRKRKKDKSRTRRSSSSSEDRSRSRKEKPRRHSSSSEDRRIRNKDKYKKRYSSNDSLSSTSDIDRKKKNKSHRKYKDNSDSDVTKHKKDKRDIDKKRKGKKKKRDRDRSPNYKKHRK